MVCYINWILFFLIIFCKIIIIITYFRVISTRIIQRIIKFCEDNSREASNKTTKFEGKDVPVLFLSKPFAHLHSDFVQQNPDCHISLSSFRKYIPKYFQRGGEKRTDMCHYCVHGEKASIELKRLEIQHRHNRMSEEIQNHIIQVIWILFFL